MTNISIIIPFYYGNKYINNLLKKLKINYDKIASFATMEVLIINDSPQELVFLNKEIDNLDIKIISNEKNIGIHGSRINGLIKSKSEYICFLDQDDDISENYLLSQITKIQNSDFVIGNGYIEKSNGNLCPIYKNARQQKLCLNKWYHYMYSNPIISPGQVLIRKSALPDEWISYNFSNNGADDYYLWLLMLERNCKGKLNEDRVYIHKYTGQNTSLNDAIMIASNFELVQILKGNVTWFKVRILERRLKYCRTNKLIKDRIKYLDVCALRFVFLVGKYL